MDAHVRLAHQSANNGVRLLRRGYNFTDGSNALGRLDAGLFFIAFVRNLVREQVQEAVQGLLGVTARPRKKRADGGAGADRDDRRGRRRGGLAQGEQRAVRSTVGQRRGTLLPRNTSREWKVAQRAIRQYQAARHRLTALGTCARNAVCLPILRSGSWRVRCD